MVGYVLIGIWMAFDPKRPPLDWKSATWLPFYLVGMGIIAWQGQFSGAPSSDKHPLPPTNTGNIPFWWDILVVFGFSLIIYFWAQRARLPRDEMLNLVNRQAGEGAGPTGPLAAGDEGPALTQGGASLRGAFACAGPPSAAPRRPRPLRPGSQSSRGRCAR